MEKKEIRIHGIPANLWGRTSKKMYLYIHGQGGNKEEAELFSQVACSYSWQVLSIDLPEHGERSEEKNKFAPWHIQPELLLIMEYVKSTWSQIALCANSIGAWFSMLSFEKEQFSNCLFISPVLDMAHLISNMMVWAGVSEEQLAYERTISTSFGQTLSWEYLSYAREHAISDWANPIEIIYGEKDNMVGIHTIEEFAAIYRCHVTIMKDGEHWFHTPEQLHVLVDWFETYLHN